MYYRDFPTSLLFHKARIYRSKIGEILCRCKNKQGDTSAERLPEVVTYLEFDDGLPGQYKDNTMRVARQQQKQSC